MRREYLWALLTLIIAIALAFILLSVAQDDNSKSQGYSPLQPSSYDRKLNRLDRRGVEAAYTNRVALLFQNWMTDTNQASQDRALRGHRNAREIFVKVMGGIDARDPPTEEDLK
jgi:hypothetical protein